MKALVIAAAFAGLAGGANAQDWGGGYVGVSAATGGGALDITGAPFDFNMDSLPGLGIYAGYNHVMASNLVLGGEISYSAQEGSDMPVNPYGYKGMLQARARMGYAMGNLMPYLALGLAKTEFNLLNVLSTDETGITFAVGADYMVNDKMSLRFEYNEARFDGVGAPTILPPGAGDLTVQTLTIGAAFHF